MAVSGDAVEVMMAQIVHMSSIMRMLLLFSSRKAANPGILAMKRATDDLHVPWLFVMMLAWKRIRW